LEAGSETAWLAAVGEAAGRDSGEEVVAVGLRLAGAEVQAARLRRRKKRMSLLRKREVRVRGAVSSFTKKLTMIRNGEARIKEAQGQA
jgi:hypothetical protein